MYRPNWTMILVILLLFISLCSGNKKAEHETKCEGFDVNGKFHKEEILTIGVNRPYQLSYYKDGREIYFSYNIGNATEDKFEIGVLQEGSTINNTMYPIAKSIPAVKNGFAVAIDEHNHVVYFGGSEGVYKSSLKKSSAVELIIEKYNIWDMFFKHHLYFITYPSQRLYKYTHDHSHHKDASIKPEHQTWIHEKIYQFAIDGDDDVFITNSSGLYMIKKGSEHRHLLSGEKIFRAIAVDSKGDAHFCGQNGIYVPMKHNHTLHKIAHVENIFGLTFDGADNIIYSNPHQIVKLVPFMCIEDINIPLINIPIKPIT